MNIKQKNRMKLLLALPLLVVGVVAPLLSFSVAYADPTGTVVECADGKSKPANKKDKPDINVLDEKDFEFACRKNNGYKKADSYVTCKDSTVQNVYKNLADPKDKLDQKDKRVACDGHGGIEVTEPEKEEPENVSGVDACKVKTSIIPVDCSTGGNPIWGLLLMTINILTAGIGIVAIGGIVYASILWTTAEDKNAQIVKSKDTIFNVVVGLVAFALLYAFLQFLIPGGVFNAGP